MWQAARSAGGRSSAIGTQCRRGRRASDGNVPTVRATAQHRCAMSRRSDEADPTPIRLHLTHMPELDTLVALEYGRVDEGTPEEWWRRVGAHVAYLHDPAIGREVGFKVREFSRLDVEALREIWRPPHFAVPMLA